jgi:hypothetical protein
MKTTTSEAGYKLVRKTLRGKQITNQRTGWDQDLPLAE